MDDVEALRAGVELRPRKGSFVFPRVWPPALAFLILSVVGGVAAGFLAPVAVAAAPAFFFLATGLVLYTALVAFRKERYTLYETRLVCARGGLLSDHETELDVRNITHVKLRLPWLRYKLLGVGDVLIESAGSEGAEIRLRSVQDPHAAFERVRGLMRHNGFAIDRGRLLHEESPDLVGIVVESFGLIISAIIGLTFAFGEALAGIALEGEGVEAWIEWLLLLGAGPTALLAVGGLVVHFLDMRRRTYRVYDDAIVYEEGFLTRDDAFIPAENLADSNTKRTFFDQVLGLYDVHISCQGSGSEIKFRRLRRGPELSHAVDEVVTAFRDRPRPAGPEAAAAAAKAESEHELGAVGGPVEQVTPGAPTVPPEEAWTAHLRPDVFRAVVGALPLLPLLPVGIPLLIQSWLQAAFTRLEVRAGSVRSRYQLLSTDEREFTYDKITGVVVNEGPFDRWLGTTTVSLWSIGAREPLDLLHVEKDRVDLPALLRQCGIRGGEVVIEAQARFDLASHAKAHVVGLIVAALLAAGGAVAGVAAHEALFGLPAFVLVVVGLGALVTRSRAARNRVTFKTEHVEMAEGIFFRRRYHARYENVKKVVLTRYPWAEKGDVYFGVAGERRFGGKQQGGGQGKEATIPYGFTARFVPGIAAKRTVVDDLLRRRLSASDVAAAEEAALRDPPPVEREGRPAAGNSVATLVLLSVVIVPLLPLLLVTVPLTLMAVRRRSYRLEPHRVVWSWGILYRRQASVIYDRIDSISRAQGALNKMFGNGSVTILTAGSSKPDLVLADLPDWNEVYQAIQKHYGKR